jgi:hypothetical protein
MTRQGKAAGRKLAGFCKCGGAMAPRVSESGTKYQACANCGRRRAESPRRYVGARRNGDAAPRAPKGKGA